MTNSLARWRDSQETIDTTAFRLHTIFGDVLIMRKPKGFMIGQCVVAWRIVASIRKVNKQLGEVGKQIEIKEQEAFEMELDEHLKRQDTAQAWQTV